MSCFDKPLVIQTDVALVIQTVLGTNALCYVQTVFAGVILAAAFILSIV